jgi:phage terminase small subunit
LNEKEQAFVLAYLKTMSPRRAALMAGYANSVAMTWAYVWVSGGGDPALSNSQRKPHVTASIRFALDLRKKEAMVTADMVVRELTRIAFADPRNAITWRTGVITETDEGDSLNGDQVTIRETVSNTVSVIASDEIDDDTAAAIKEIRQNADGSISLKFHDKRAALADLGKHLGIMDDSLRFKGHDGGPVVISPEANAKQAADAWQAMKDADDA